METTALVSVAPFSPRRKARACVDEMSALLASSNDSLDPDSFAAKAALLLLTAARFGQNIDRLSRLTGCERELVARCARRWYDSGVWAAGRTVSPWVEHGPEHPSLWNDVAVAEGVLWRSVDGAGNIQWTPAGARTDFSRPDGQQAPESGGAVSRSAEGGDRGWQAGRTEKRPHRAVLFPDAVWLT